MHLDHQGLDLDQRGRPREPARGGRPTKYTVPRVVAILGALFDGETRAEAARRAGVSPAAFYVWLSLGRQGHPTYAPLAEAVANAECAGALRGGMVRLARHPGFWKVFA